LSIILILIFILKAYFFKASPSTSSLVDNSHEQVDQNQQVKQTALVSKPPNNIEIGGKFAICGDFFAKCSFSSGTIFNKIELPQNVQTFYFGLVVQIRSCYIEKC